MSALPVMRLLALMLLWFKLFVMSLSAMSLGDWGCERKGWDRGRCVGTPIRVKTAWLFLGWSVRIPQ